MVHASFVARHHRQSQDNFVLDKLRYVHAAGCEHAVDLVVGFRNLAQVLGELQLCTDPLTDNRRHRLPLLVLPPRR